MEKAQYTKLKALYAAYIEKRLNSFNQKQRDLSEELSNKLVVLEDYSDKITELTNKLSDVNGLFGMTFNHDTGELKFGDMEPIVIKRANPNIPVQIDNGAKAYSKKSRSLFSDQETLAMEDELEKSAIAYYQTAHRICDIAQLLPGLKTYDCKPIRIVRNQLIEHPEGKNSGVTFDSFAYSKNEGPFIKGMRLNNQLNHRDQGFVINSTQFIESFEKALEKATI